MKTFIVSMAIIIMGTAGLIFNSELTRYVILEENLQNLTEQCACAAAWALEETEEGIQISELKALLKVNKVIEYNQKYNPVFSNGKIVLALNGFSIDPVYKRTARVKLNYIANKAFFRINPALNIKQLSWESYYEWKDMLN